MTARFSVDQLLRTFLKISFVAAVVLTPLGNIGEIAAILSQTVKSHYLVLTPYFLKSLKDQTLFLVLLAAAVLRLLSGVKINWWLIGTMVCWGLSVLFSLPDQDAFILVAGLRWSLPLLLIFFVQDACDDDVMAFAARVMSRMMPLVVLLQTFQLINGSNWYGTNSWGLSVRNPGIFLIPSSMAFFSACCIFFVANFGPKTGWQKFVMLVLCPLSILLTASGTGVLAMILLVFGYFVSFQQLRKYVLPFALAGAVCGAVALPMLTGRGDIFVSMMIRVDLFLESMRWENILVSLNFGSATNTASLLSASELVSSSVNTSVADSIFLSMILNIGLVGTILFTSFIASLMQATLKHWSFLCVFGCFALTTVMFESFPMNFMFVLALSYFWRGSLDVVNRRQLLVR